MRKIKITHGEHYHIYNRGNNKQNIFLDERDWARFLFLILYFQSPIVLTNLSRPATSFVKHRVFNISSEKEKEIIENRNIELICFVLMPNHFHFLIKEIKPMGISCYMQRILNAYTKYFNAKYEKSGHLFQGPFRVVHMKNNEQLLYLSTYIHRNPRELKEYKNKKESLCEWSSYQDYIKNNRWNNFLCPQIIADQFSSAEEYKNFTEASSAKLAPEEYLID